MSKRIALILLALVLVLSLVACGGTDDKDKGSSKNPSSSEVTSGDPTQDYNKGEFDETPITNDELEDLWGELTDNDAEIIVGGDKDEDTSSTTSGTTSSTGSTTSSSTSSTGSSSTGSTSSSSSSSTTGSEDEDSFSGTGSIGNVSGAIF